MGWFPPSAALLPEPPRGDRRAGSVRTAPGSRRCASRSCGWCRSRAGRSCSAGVHLGGKPEESALRAVALVPEGRHIFADLTAEENPGLGLRRAALARGGSQRISTGRTACSRSSRISLSEGRPALRRASSKARDRVHAGSRGPDVLLLDGSLLGPGGQPSSTRPPRRSCKVRDRGVTILLVEQRGMLTVGFADRTHGSCERGGRGSPSVPPTPRMRLAHRQAHGGLPVATFLQSFIDAVALGAGPQRGGARSASCSG